MDFYDFLNAYGFIVNEYSGEVEPAAFSAAPCPFLKYEKEKAVCKIYPVRSWICEGYPGPGLVCRGGRKRV
jgi:Fe-S-cluster containining protein